MMMVLGGLGFFGWHKSLMMDLGGLDSLGGTKSGSFTRKLF
jgi:hypothetical protein